MCLKVWDNILFSWYRPSLSVTLIKLSQDEQDGHNSTRWKVRRCIDSCRYSSHVTRFIKEKKEKTASFRRKTLWMMVRLSLLPPLRMDAALHPLLTVVPRGRLILRKRKKMGLRHLFAIIDQAGKGKETMNPTGSSTSKRSLKSLLDAWVRNASQKITR